MWVQKSVPKPVGKSVPKVWVQKPVTKPVGNLVTMVAVNPRPTEMTMVQLWKKKYSKTQDATLYKAAANHLSKI